MFACRSSDPYAKLKSHIMQHFIRVYTVCYSKKELHLQKYNIFRKVYLTSLYIYNGLSQVNNCFKPESKNSLISIQKFKFKRMSCELCLIWFLSPINNLSFIYKQVILCWTSTKLNVLAQGHNAVTPVGFEPAAPKSRFKHSTTKPLRSHELRTNKEVQEHSIVRALRNCWLEVLNP